MVVLIKVCMWFHILIISIVIYYTCVSNFFITINIFIFSCFSIYYYELIADEWKSDQITFMISAQWYVVYLTCTCQKKV